MKYKTRIVSELMDFSDALRGVKKGKKIQRKGWNGRNMFVVYQKGYPKGIPCNEQTAAAFGLKPGENFVCLPYLQIRNVDGSHAMWVPSISDLLADDWVFIETYVEGPNDEACE